MGRNNTPPDGTKTLEEALLYLQPSLTKPQDMLDTIQGRDKVHSFIDEYIYKEEFVDTVRRYARQEIDSAVLKTLKSVAGIAIGTAIAWLVGFFTNRKIWE